MNNPFMHYVDDFEKEAEAFLTKYRCADAIENPRPIPILDIAQKLMSLEVIDSEYLSSDNSVQGAIAFTPGIIEVFDWSSQEYIGYEINYPAIWVDANIINQGRVNNTIAHECYHWWRHRNYFNFRRKHQNGAEFAFRCNKGSITKGSSIPGEWTDIDRMEWQARTIAPKILMPQKATKKKIDLTYKRLLDGDKSLHKRDVTVLVIDTIADFFEVSKQSAAIRMLELGYQEAQPYCEFCDQDQLLPCHNDKSTHAKRHQQQITTAQAFELYRNNEFLRATLDTGAFRFIDGYFVLNDAKYTCSNGLTSYAREHLAECTLDFAVKLQRDHLMHSKINKMFRSDSIYWKKTTFDATTQNIELYNRAKDFEKQFKRNLSKISATTPAAWMKQRMSEEHWYEKTFEEKTSLDKMHYSRVQSETHRFSMLPLLAMGVGLNLDITEMEEVLQLGGMSFKPGDRNHQAYRYLFTSMRGQGIDACNEFLEKVGVETLGTKERNNWR